MGIYNIRCKICKHEFQAELKMFDENPCCPECENGTERIFKNVPSTHFKGVGFAANDLKDNLKRDKHGRIQDVVPGAE